MTQAISSNLGFPRIGAFRELKLKGVEPYWKGDITLEQLKTLAKEIRANNWKLQQSAGIQHIPSNDFSLYDHVLDTIAMVGAVPARYDVLGANPTEQDFIDQYFAMARGGRAGKLKDVPAMEMTKWLDTNYHYIVPELNKGQTFKLACTKALKHFEEAKALGITTRPVLVGPVSFLLLGKMKDGGNALDLLPALIPVYQEIISKLAAAGAEWIQIDEPALVLDLNDAQRAAFKDAYAKLATKSAKLLVATYFTDLGDSLETALNLPVAALHIDVFRGEKQLDAALAKAPANLILSLGVVEGRNIWKNDYSKSLAKLDKAVAKLGKERVIVAPSCSLLHSPVDLANETTLDAEVKNWLAFATQKLTEVSVLAKAINNGRDSVKAELEANAAAMESRRTSKRIHNDAVKARVAAITPEMANRKSAYPARAAAQAAELNLPLFPTTTIGSFPQTAEVRAARAANKAGKLSDADYTAFLEKTTADAIKWQEEIDVDVLVHGEFERNDMVEYFGEQLAGFAFSKNGWVQSYGSRCVKPPIIFGDVSRPTPMTVKWATFSQSQTKRPMKGMLTGPITILQWSFVRDDQPRETTTKQIALAIRDEVVDLEKAGIKIIQIDEAALREGLPLHRAEWADYLRWAVESFRITASGVADKTQIHTHMCYSEFNDIIQAVGAMDADVISIETSRSQMELLDAFVNYKYPNEIGPGVYDIHSPIVPTEQQMNALLQKALKVLDAKQIWVNPDCGLKTRAWPETKAALVGMVASAKALRNQVSGANGKKAANG
jgi:5-methyltetrahydropteroyltriglutamate--homocysteine methyltransferase